MHEISKYFLSTENQEQCLYFPDSTSIGRRRFTLSTVGSYHWPLVWSIPVAPVHEGDVGTEIEGLKAVADGDSAGASA